MKRTLTLLMLFLYISIGWATAQTRTVQGVVTYEEDGLPVMGATVRVNGTQLGTVTDADGKFSISKVPASAKMLTISYVGMQTQEVAIKENLKITLKTNSELLDEVMVVAFGTTKKSAFTGSAAVVNTEKLSERITTNVSDALVGSVAGLQIRGNSGAPGSSENKINIRGIASMYADTDPLIIVDGAPYSASLSNIPQNDIESISVLKDAASAALYGARGAAGVIIVTTKKGKTQTAEVNVDMKWGVNSRAVQDYDIITDPGQYYEAYYAQLYNYSFYRQGNSASAANAWANQNMLDQLGYNVYNVPEGEMLIGMDGKLNPNATLGRTYTRDGVEYYLRPDDWQDAAYRNSLRQEYTVSVNAGNDKSSFYASLGYLNDEGIIINSDYERITGRIRADYQVKKWLKLGANVGYIHSIQHSIPNGGTNLTSTNMMYFTSAIAPIYPLYVRTIGADGKPSILKDENGRNNYDFGNPNSGYGLKRPFMSGANPLANNQYDQLESEGNQLNATFTADINITSFLKANITSNVNWGQTNYSNYGNPYFGSKASVNGEINKRSTSALRTNNVQTLTYFQDFDEHSISAMAGHEYYKTTTKFLSAIAQGGFSPAIPEIDAFAKPTDASSYKDVYNVEGYFASAQYDYDDKYFASASYRRDASSRFAKENRWGNFWSVGAAWMMNKELFMESTESWLDELKLKFSVGQQGNDNIDDFAYADMYDLIPTGDTSMGATFWRKGNPDITWETTTNYNVGLEFSLWKGRFSGSIDYYNKKTTDLLFWLSIPESSGSRGYFTNVGDIRNHGVELALTGSIIRTKDLDWSLSANISHNKTKILKLPASKTQELGGFMDNYENQSASFWFKEGGELYNAYMIECAGINDKGETLYWVDDELEKPSAPGKNRTSTTTSVEEATYYEQGSILPKAFGGFNTTLQWKGIDVSLSFDYQIGGKVTDYRYASLMTPNETADGAGQAIHKDYIKSWSPNNVGSDIPRWQYGDKYTVSAKSDRFLTNASYLNFQSFTVGYTLPKKWSKHFSKLRVYAAGENLCFWSARKGLDPRYSFDGNSSVTPYSPARNISGGIQLTF